MIERFYAPGYKGDSVKYQNKLDVNFFNSLFLLETKAIEKDLFYKYKLPPDHLLHEYTYAFEFKNSRHRHWKTKLLKLYKQTCLLTGIIETDSKNTLLAGHHLYSKQCTLI